MTIWGSFERFLPVGSDADAGTRSEALIEEIAHSLAAAGAYVAQVDARTTQRVVDFNWCARQAGRRLGIRVHVDIKYPRTLAEGQAEVSVTPLKAPN